MNTLSYPHKFVPLIMGDSVTLQTTEYVSINNLHAKGRYMGENTMWEKP